MSNGYANIDRLIGLKVQVHNTGMEEVDLEGEIDAAWITQDDHVRVLVRYYKGNGVNQWGEWMIDELKMVGPTTMLSREEQDLADRGQKIQAIKEYRTRTGMGLKDAKDAVESWLTVKYGNPGAPPCSGCYSHGHSSVNCPITPLHKYTIAPCPNCGSTNHVRC